MLYGIIICSLDSGILLYSEKYQLSLLSSFFSKDDMQLTSSLFAIYKSISSTSLSNEDTIHNKLNFIRYNDVTLHFLEKSSSSLSYLLVISISNDIDIPECQHILKLISSLFERSDIYASSSLSVTSSQLLLSPRSSSIKSMKGELIKLYINILEEYYNNMIGNIDDNVNDNIIYNNDNDTISIIFESKQLISKYCNSNHNNDNSRVFLAEKVCNQWTNQSFSLSPNEVQKIREELALINEHKRIKKNWFSRLCGCVTKDTRNNIHCNESNITNTNSINSNTDDDIEIHPIVLVNGSINRSEDKISYANSIIHKMIKDKMEGLLQLKKTNSSYPIIPTSLFGDSFTLNMNNNDTFNIIENSGIVFISTAAINNNKTLTLFCKWANFCIEEKII